MNREIDAVQVTGDFEPERAAADADEAAFDWMFDSGRDYLEQIAAYKTYVKGADCEGAAA
jgi:hypothetical protein